MIIIMLGAPASGKGSVAEILSKAKPGMTAFISCSLSIEQLEIVIRRH